MKRYLVDTPMRLELVRVAIDQANGLRDINGSPTPRTARIFRGGLEVTGTAYDPQTWGMFCGTTATLDEPVLGDDGTAALELPETPEVERHLGKTVRGTKLPRASDLVDGEDALPTRVRAAIQQKRSLAAFEEALGLGQGKRG